MFDVELDEQSVGVLNNVDGWQDVVVSRATETVYLFGQKDGFPAGQAVVPLNINKNELPCRTVRIESVYVRPEYREDGLGTKILSGVDTVAEKFGAARITGIIAPVDVEKKPWLEAFYRKRGYQLTPIGKGFDMEKKIGNEKNDSN